MSMSWGTRQCLSLKILTRSLVGPSLSLVYHLVNNFAPVERVLAGGRCIGERMLIDLAEPHLVGTGPCLVPTQVDLMYDSIRLDRIAARIGEHRVVQRDLLFV